jgi:hypothetical protein
MVVVFRVADEHAMSVNDRIKSKTEYHIKGKIEQFKLPYTWLSQESNKAHEEKPWKH